MLHPKLLKEDFHIYLYKILSNETRFNSSAFNAWKGAFRECTKLASGIATENRRQKIKEWKNPQEKNIFSFRSIIRCYHGRKLWNCQHW